MKPSRTDRVRSPGVSRAETQSLEWSSTSVKAFADELSANHGGVEPRTLGLSSHTVSESRMEVSECHTRSDS